MRLRNSRATDTLIAAAIRGELIEPQFPQLAGHSSEVLALALLAASKRIAELRSQARSSQVDPATTSGQQSNHRRHRRNYCNRVYEIQERNGHKPSYIDKRFSKIKTVINWLDKINLSPDQSRRSRAMWTILIAPKKRKTLPMPISRADVEELLKVANVEETAIVFLGVIHAFRKTMNSLLIKACEPHRIRQSLSRHSPKGITDGIYSDLDSLDRTC